jgi:cytochrome c-type biogenesis protein CcmH/NrfG
MPAKKPAARSARRGEREQIDTEITFLEGIVRRDPGYVEALQLLGDDYTRQGRFADGLRVDRQLTELQPTDALAHYNLACSYSLTAQFELAAAALERALDLGYRDVRWLRRDPDLRDLRAHPLYRKIRTRLKYLKGAAE